MRLPSKIFVIAALALGGCGGSSDSPPTPLTMRFDDMYIAAIPLDQKQSVVQTQNDWSVAKMENAKTDADLNESNTQLSIVHNDQAVAKLSVDSAASNKKSADASADTNRISQTTKDLHTAQDLAKAADQRVVYFEAYREYLRRLQRHAQENMYWREAQYELAKAQLGQKNNIAPKGLSYDEFVKQEKDRGKREASSKQRVESEKQHALSARDNWRQAQETADRESGRPTSFPDPMAQKSTSASQ